MHEKALCLEVTELVIADGTVAEIATIAAIAADTLGQTQGEYFCAFVTWHHRSRPLSCCN
jgi:hypothetical protein